MASCLRTTVGLAAALLGAGCLERPGEDLSEEFFGENGFALITAPSGFYFYPPLAPAPTATGVALLDQAANLTLELVTAGPDGELDQVIATFSSRTTPVLRLKEGRDLYSVQLRAADHFANPTAPHRFRVRYRTELLAFADLPPGLDRFLARYPNFLMTINFRLERDAIDRDRDTVIDPLDTCPDTADADQLDTDGDRIGDACECDFVQCAPRTACEASAACEPATGECVYSPVADGSPCSDGDACNGAESCLAGECSVAVPLVCDDGDACTSDACAPSVGCVFTPVACEGVVAARSPTVWLRAQDITAADGASITTWPAAPGTTNDASQTSATLRPIYRATGLGGRPAVEFDGTNDRLDLRTNAFSAAGFPMSVFAVLRTTDTNGHVIGTGSSSAGFLTSYGAGVTVVNGNAVLKANSNSSGVHLASSAAVNVGQPRIVAAVARSGASELFVDCRSRGVSGAATNPWAYTKATIGASDGSNTSASQDPFAGAIAELIVIPGAASADDRLQIERYLAQKYGVDCEQGPPPAPEETLAATATMFWRFEETGTSARLDLVSGQNVLPYPTDASGIRSVSGVVGRANFVEGPNGYHFWLPSSGVMDHGGGSFTWAGWMKLASFFDSQTFVGKWNEGSSTQREYRIRYNATSQAFELEVSSTGRAADAAVLRHPRAVALDTFYFIEAWHDASARTINLRIGTQSDRGTVVSMPWSAGVYFGSADLNIGAHNTCADDHLHGVIDAVGFWRRTLTAAESERLWGDGFGFEPGVLPPSQIPGCDGVLGSGATIDACGVCGGGGASCEDEAVVATDRVLWLRADDLALANGASVETWADASGASNDASQATATRRPTYRTAQIAGHAVLELDGVDDRLDLATNLFSSTSFPVTVFVVLRTTDASAHVIGTGSSSAGYLTSYGSGVTLNGGAPTLKANSNSSGLHIGATARADDGTARLITAVASTASSRIQLDCANATTSVTAPNAYAYTKSTIGASDGSRTDASRDTFAGQIAEVIVYHRTVPAIERAAIERYLSGKYQLATTACR
ncbi:hypothetical protein L6R52_26895 [Myxococcota bacterium]|nr:hypothetical protein [Myxococcota bacterium]